MFSKTIEYEDFNGKKTAKVFYFHLSKAELIEMGVSDMQSRIQRILESEDGAAILHEFRELIRMSVGVRSEDGQEFIKDESARAQLFNSPAYDELLMELATDAKASTEFIKNLLPEKMQKELVEQLKKQGDAPDPFAEKEDARPAYQREHRHPTNAEMLAMTKEELAEAFRWREENNK